MTSAAHTLFNHGTARVADINTGILLAAQRVAWALDRLFLSLFLAISGGLALTAVFLLAYTIKCMLGIDLIPGWHLADLFR